MMLREIHPSRDQTGPTVSEIPSIGCTRTDVVGVVDATRKSRIPIWLLLESAGHPRYENDWKWGIHKFGDELPFSMVVTWGTYQIFRHTQVSYQAGGLYSIHDISRIVPWVLVTHYIPMGICNSFQPLGDFDLDRSYGYRISLSNGEPVAATFRVSQAHDSLVKRGQHQNHLSWNTPNAWTM